MGRSIFRRVVLPMFSAEREMDGTTRNVN